MRGLVVENDVEQRAMDLQSAVVMDETRLPEPVHEKASTTPSRPELEGVPDSPVSTESLTGRSEWAGSYFSAPTRRRSLCGSVRGWPVLSSHFSPGLAPQVGQRTARACFRLAVIAPSCSVARQQDVQF
jgi:hypothetical protein